MDNTPDTNTPDLVSVSFSAAIRAQLTEEKVTISHIAFYRVSDTFHLSVDEKDVREATLTKKQLPTIQCFEIHHILS